MRCHYIPRSSNDMSSVFIPILAGDETIWTPRSHGNSHDKQTTFTSNTAECRASIRQMAHQSGKEPMLVYRKSLQNVAAQDPFFQQRQDVVGPRNKKQVQ